MLDRPSMKGNARLLMAAYTPAVYATAAVFMAIDGIITFLLPRLIGIQAELARFSTEVMTVPLPDVTPIQLNIPPLGGVLAAILFLFRIVISIGFIGYCLKISRNEKVEIRDLFDGFTLFFKIIRLEILRVVFTLLWSLLFVVPGIIASFRYSQAYFILMENPEKGVLQCISESKIMMRGKKTDYFILSLSFIGWSFLSSIFQMYLVIPLILIWLNPYITITKALFYNYICGHTTAETNLPEQ
jgi:uncharacterized membrane protein